MGRKITGFIVAASLVLPGCSSRPREFTPQLAAGTDQARFDAAYSECQQLYIAGKLGSDGRLASAGAGAAVGAATAAVGTTAAVATAGYAGAAMAAATVVLLPFAVIGGAWGLARKKRAQKEQAIKTAMEGCLKERQFEVTGWSQVTGKPVADKVS